MALGVAGDAALSPRLDCVMEKRRLQITVSGLEYHKGDPLKSNGIDIDVCPSYSINSIVPPSLFSSLKFSVSASLLQQTKASSALRGTADLLRPYDHSSRLNDSFNSSYSPFTGYIYILHVVTTNPPSHVYKNPPSPQPAFPGMSFSCPLDSSVWLYTVRSFLLTRPLLLTPPLSADDGSLSASC